MRASAIITQLRSTGAIVKLEGDRLLVQPGPDGIPDDLRADLKTNRDAVIDALRPIVCVAEWLAVVDEIGVAYEFSGVRVGPESWETRRDSLAAVGDAMKSGNREQALAAIEEWRRAWMDLFKGGR